MENHDGLRIKNGLAIFLLLMAVNIPPLLYGTFDADRFSGWSSYLGGRWFSAMADRMQLNYGCAPSAMLENIQGFAFCYAVLLLLACAAALVYAGKEIKAAPLLVGAGVAAMTIASAGLVYFDAIYSRLPPPYICRTTSFEMTEAALSDEIVRHLCNQVGSTMAMPLIVLLVSYWIYQRLKRRGRKTGSSAA